VVSGFDSTFMEFIADWNAGENIYTETEGNNRMEKTHNDFHEVNFPQNNFKDTKLMMIGWVEHV